MCTEINDINEGLGLSAALTIKTVLILSAVMGHGENSTVNGIKICKNIADLSKDSLISRNILVIMGYNY